MKNLSNFLILTVLVTGLASCKGGMSGYEKTAGGIEYKILKKGGDKAIKVGDNLKLNFENRTQKDSVIFSSAKNGAPVEFQLSEARNAADIMSIFPLLHEGDSVEVLVVVDSMYKKNLPPFAKSGDKVKFLLGISKVMNNEEMAAAKLEASKAQNVVDAKLIDEYVAANKLDVKTTESGIRYIMEKEGTGDLPKEGDMVSVHYTGTLLDGTKFDSSLDRGEPFPFALGKGQVIKGWDEGIMLFKKGGKGKLIIPSSLAYGSKAMGPTIKPNSVLVFDIELLDFKPAPTE